MADRAVRATSIHLEAHSWPDWRNVNEQPGGSSETANVNGLWRTILPHGAFEARRDIFNDPGVRRSSRTV